MSKRLQNITSSALRRRGGGGEGVASALEKSIQHAAGRCIDGTAPAAWSWLKGTALLWDMKPLRGSEERRGGSKA